MWWRTCCLYSWTLQRWFMGLHFRFHSGFSSCWGTIFVAWLLFLDARLHWIQKYSNFVPFFHWSWLLLWHFMTQLENQHFLLWYDAFQKGSTPFKKSVCCLPFLKICNLVWNPLRSNTTNFASAWASSEQKENHCGGKWSQGSWLVTKMKCLMWAWRDAFTRRTALVSQIMSLCHGNTPGSKVTPAHRRS